MSPPHAIGPVPAELVDRPVLMLVQRPRGAARVVSVSPSAIYVQTFGHLDVETAQQISEATLRAAATRTIVSLVDWSTLVSYDAGARQALTKMVLSNFRQFAGVTVLTGSPLISVGVSTAGLATAFVGVHVHGTTDRDEFMAIVRQHLR